MIEIKIDGYTFKVYPGNVMAMGYIVLSLDHLDLDRDEDIMHYFTEIESDAAPWIISRMFPALEKYPFKKALNKYRNLKAFL